jgi:hypothetical protein
MNRHSGFLDRLTAGDRWLALALLLGAVLSAYGLWWGWVESWSADEMAFRNVFWHGHPLEPADFAKPPFHTYVNLLLCVLPMRALEWVLKLTGTHWNPRPAMLWWARIIQIGFLLGVIYLSFRIVVRFATLQSARITALLTATAAGFILHVHFLTADIPVIFWMLAAFYLAQDIALTGNMRAYVLAGLLTGVATATKYNGLAVGMAIPVFHYIANRGLPFTRMAFDQRFLAGLAAVLGGFIVANPYSVLDYPHFAADFAYNYAVTPVYDGSDPSQHGFLLFLRFIPEIIGWPLTLVAAVAALYSIVRLRHAELAERATVAAALAVFVLYFVQFGRAPRVEVRFVLPVVPFLLIAAAPLWALGMRQYQRVAITAASLLIAYNVCASYWVGKRFVEDPRMSALEWIRQNAPPSATIESTQYTPNWELHGRIPLVDVRMPTFSGRARVLAKVFKSNEAMMRQVISAETDESMTWYTADALAQRHPDFIALDSKYFGRFLDGNVADEYPQARAFMTDLLAGRLGYRVVFDKSTPGSPSWLYPEDIDFVDNRLVILRRGD